MLATAVFGLATVGDEADASEPADAVKRLLRAASDSDVLGAMEAVLPSGTGRHPQAAHRPCQ